jgi:soluble cytochrome b562
MNLTKLIEAAKEIENRYHKLEERTKFMRDLAIKAKRTGKSLTHKMPSAPEVVDFEDPIRDLIDALHEKDRK